MEDAVTNPISFLPIVQSKETLPLSTLPSILSILDSKIYELESELSTIVSQHQEALVSAYRHHTEARDKIRSLLSVASSLEAFLDNPEACDNEYQN